MNNTGIIESIQGKRRRVAFVGEKYRTGVCSETPVHLEEVQAFIDAREDSSRVLVEVTPLTQYVRSAEEHQDRLATSP